MRRIIPAIAILALVVLIIPVNASVVKYTSGDLAVKALDNHIGAMFRNVNVDDERYVFILPLIVEFKDLDGSGNLTLNDEIVAIAVLKHLTLTINSSDGNVTLEWTGDVALRGPGVMMPMTAHVDVYITISNATANEAKRGINLDRPMINEEDSIALLVIFQAVDPTMALHNCQYKRKYKHEYKYSHELMLQQSDTEAYVKYENTCLCDGSEKNVNVTSFARNYDRRQHFSKYYNIIGHAASQVVFPAANNISYDPEITVETASGTTIKTAAKIGGIIIAILLVLAALVVVLRNHSK